MVMMVIMLAGFVGCTPVFCADVNVMMVMVMTHLMITITQIVIHFFTSLYLNGAFYSRSEGLMFETQMITMYALSSGSSFSVKKFTLVVV